jgi:hypothetical protein
MYTATGLTFLDADINPPVAAAYPSLEFLDEYVPEIKGIPVVLEFDLA